MNKILNKNLEVKLLDSYQSKSVTPLSKFETSNEEINSSGSESDFCLKDGKYNTEFNKLANLNKRHNKLTSGILGSENITRQIENAPYSIYSIKSFSKPAYHKKISLHTKRVKAIHKKKRMLKKGSQSRSQPRQIPIETKVNSKVVQKCTDEKKTADLNISNAANSLSIKNNPDSLLIMLRRLQGNADKEKNIISK